MPGPTWKGQTIQYQPGLKIQALGSLGTGTTTPDITQGAYVTMTLTGATRTIAAPLNPFTGAQLWFDILNSSGGAVTITWNAVFVQTTVPVAPASTKRRVIGWIFDGTSWVQIA